MEENPECNCCNTWEEEMYWKHFNSVHFCLTLTSDFHDHLVLPEKFAAHMNALPAKVSLKGPSGALWEIELLKSDDLLFVGNGWKDFVKVNDLNENCILVFNYKRSSSFEVLIFDERSSCEKESAYFVKKHRLIESNLEDQKKRTASEASSDKIEDNDDEGPAFAVTKKSKKDGEEVVRLREKLNAPTSKKRVLCAAARPKGRLRRVVPPLNPPSDKKIKSGKSIINENLKEPNQISNQDRITSENGGILPEKDHSQKVLTKSRKKSNGKGSVDELTQNAKDLTTPENGKNSLAADHSHILKAQSENPLLKNVTAIDPSQTKVKYLLTMENGDGLRVTDNFYSEKAPSENRLNRNDTSKDRSQTLQEELITPENSESSPVADCSPDFEGQAEKEPNGRSIAKDAIPISVWGPLVTSDYRESSPEKDHPCKSRGKRGQPKKQVPTSSKKSGLKRGKSFSKEYKSNRRPVTEEEKNDALRRANQKQTENSFTAIMRPTCVYRRFFLQIPAEWQFKNLFRHKQEVILRVGENSWHASIVNYGCKNRGISTGWKKFSLENFLEEFDVLVFQLGGQKDEALVVIDVDIFRVIPRGSVDQARNLLEEMSKEGLNPDVYCFTALMGGYCKLGQMDKVEAILQEMCMNGIIPNKITYTIMIDGYSKMGDAEKAAKLLEKMIHDGIIPDNVTYNALTSGLCKDGKMGEAFTVTDTMAQQGVLMDDVTYTTLIHGLAQPMAFKNQD